MIDVFIMVLLVSSAHSTDWELNYGNETDGKVLKNLGSILPSVLNITWSKLPAIPKRNTITLTTTVINQETKYIPIRPTCLKLLNIKSVCDGRIETRLPTDLKHIEIRPSLTQAIHTTATSDSFKQNIVHPINLEPSYSNEKSNTFLTPTIDFKHFQPMKNYLEHLFGPKYEFTTKYQTSTKLVEYTDDLNTVTVVAENCIPPKLELPICDFSELHYPSQVLIAKGEVENVKKSMENSVQKVYDTLNKFYIDNPFSFLGINPEHSEVGDEEKEESLIEKSVESFPLNRKIDDANN